MKLPDGIKTVFDHKKWVFTYICLAVCAYKLNSDQFLNFIMIAFPAVLSANAFDKSSWRKENA